MADPGTGIKTLNGIMPPFEANFAQHDFAHRFADTSNLDIEGIECQEPGPQVIGGEKRCQIAILIAGADELEAISSTHLTFSTASKAALTSRFSASRIL